MSLSCDFSTTSWKGGSARMMIHQRWVVVLALAMVALSACSASSHLERGFAHIEHGRYEKAIVAFDKAIRLRPDDADAYNNRGNAYVFLGRYEKAIADYDEAIRLQPDLADAYYNRGVAYAQLGKPAEAISDLETALELAQAAGNDDLAASIEETLKAVRDP